MSMSNLDIKHAFMHKYSTLKYSQKHTQKLTWLHVLNQKFGLVVKSKNSAKFIKTPNSGVKPA